MEHAYKNPLRIGLESARATVVPMAVLWFLVAVVVLGYYFVPGFDAFLEPLANWQRSGGNLAAFSNLFVFCGLLPGVFLLTVPTLRPKRPYLTILAQSAWCGLWGVVNNGLYTLQSQWFGNGTDIVTLLLKTSVDQFVWSALVLSPTNAVFFFWLARDFSCRRVKAEWPSSFVRDIVLPNLVANWVVWIPVLCIIYAFPLVLQVQLAGLASSFWALMCLQIGKRSATAGAGRPNR